MSVTWQKDTEAQAQIVWENKDWDDKQAINADSSTQTLMVPKDSKTSRVRSARIFIRSKELSLLKVSQDVSVAIGSEDKSEPSGK